jgi:hypothetical protein
MQNPVPNPSSNTPTTHLASPKHAVPFHANHQFIAMLDAFRRSGGMAQAYEVVALFLARGESDITSLAQWILHRKVISIEWESKLWLPLFQFDPLDMQPQPGLAPVLSELNPVYTAWDLANWFSRPHPWLNEGTPADTLKTDAMAVVKAAQFDRLVAVG